MAKEPTGTPQGAPNAGLQPPADDGGVGAPGAAKAGGPPGNGASADATSQPGAPATEQEALGEPQNDEERTYKGRYETLRPHTDRVESENADLKAKLEAAQEGLGRLKAVEETFGGTEQLIAAAKTPAATEPPAQGYSAPQAQDYGTPVGDAATILRQHVQETAELQGWNQFQAQDYAAHLERQAGVQLLPRGQADPAQAPVDLAEFRKGTVQEALNAVEQRQQAAERFDQALDASLEVVEAGYTSDWLNETIVAPDTEEFRNLGIAGKEIRRSRAAERYCAATGVPDMSKALFAVDPQGVVGFQAEQIAEAKFDERMRQAATAGVIAPGALMGAPEAPSPSDQVTQAVEASGVAASKPPPVD